MEWVASQPQPPSKNRTSTARLANLFNPLRKSPSSKDLQQASAGYIAYSNPSSYVSTPLQSSTQSSSPPTTYGFTSNKVRLGRAFAEGSGKTKDDSAFFIPYKGPISPPSAHITSFGHNTDNEKTLIDRRVYLQLDRNGQPAASYKDQRSSVNDAFYPRDPVSSTAHKIPLVLDEGLPSAYLHGGNMPSTDHSTATRSIGYQSYLPSSMRFDVSDKDDPSSTQSKGAVAFGQSRAPIIPSRSLVSPMASPALLTINSRAFPTIDAKAVSITSSEGNASSIVHEDSASTSMTSLRGDHTVNSSKARYSHDGPPPSAFARQRARTNTASLGSIKSEAKTDEKFEPAAFSRGTAEERNTETLPVGAGGSNTASPRLPTSGKDEAIQIDSPSTFQRDAASPKENLENDLKEAREKYEALQKIHQQETKIYAPHQSGWLEPSSNCEKLLSPRPNLRSSRVDGYDSDNNQATKKDEEIAAAFERYRDSKASKSSPLLIDKARAQNVLSGSGHREEKQTNNGTPLFHHRMPPPIPENENVASRQSSRPDHVQIPPRRSSQSRKRRTVQSRAQSRATTAPKVSFQDQDVDVLDLATVLAQGKALEEERAKWREQYRRSVGRARSTGTITPEQKRELAELKRVRYGDDVLPEMPTEKSRRSRSASSDANAVRRSRSSPNLNRSQFEWQSDKESVQDVPPAACIDFHMSTPFQSRTAPKNKGNHLRRRSQSSGNLAATFNCLPKLCRRRRSSTILASNHEKMQTKDAPPMPHLSTAKDTQVITRQSALTEARTSPGLGQGPYKYKYPRSPDPGEDTFGVAFSAPRPNVGHIDAPTDPTFFAGRHETKYDYPLLTSPHSSIYGRPSVVRNDSLGMTQVGESLDGRKQEEASPRLDTFEPAKKSLPVPPRRCRSSQTNSSKDTPKGTPNEEKSYFDPLSQIKRFQSNACYTPADDFTTPGAFYTPPLEPTLNLYRQGSSHPDTDVKRDERFEKIDHGTVEGSRSHRSMDHGTLANSDDSSYSPRSIPAKELWNTDEHPEEAFTGLFFRRPGVFIERDRSMSDTTVKPGSDTMSKRFAHHLTVEEARPRKSKESMYRSSLHGKRDSLEIQKMVGSYIDSMSNDGSFDDDDATFQREGDPAWNDSTSNVYRQETLRIGRVGDRRPEVRSAYQYDADILEAGHDDSIGPASSRARQGSFAASFIMATDSPDQRQHQDHFESNVQEEDEPRISDVSLANMVRDYIWPDPPAEKTLQS